MASLRRRLSESTFADLLILGCLIFGSLLLIPLTRKLILPKLIRIGIFSAGGLSVPVATMYPGYSGIVQYGHRSFLAMALGFALLVDAFLIANFYWTALITVSQRNILLVVLFGTWVALMVAAAYWKHCLDVAARPEQHDDTFRQTICHYLRGDWFAAESQILPYLKKYPKDTEMLLLQATMYRHTKRYEEAMLVLDKLQLLQNSRYWYAEIEMERSLLLSAQKTDAAPLEASRSTDKHSKAVGSGT